MTDQTEAPVQAEAAPDPVEVGWAGLRRYLPSEIENPDECPAEVTELATELGNNILSRYEPPEAHEPEAASSEGETSPEGETPPADYSVQVVQLLTPEKAAEPADV